MHLGFERANVDRMLAGFGGSKATVFRHFPTKRALFEGVIRRTALRWEPAVHWTDIGTDDPQAWLSEFGSRVLVWLLSPEPMFLGRTAVAEGHAFPNLRHLFPDLALQPIKDVIAGKLRAWTQAGLIRANDPDGVTALIMDILFIGAVADNLFWGREQQADSEIRAHIEPRVRLVLDGLARTTCGNARRG